MVSDKTIIIFIILEAFNFFSLYALVYFDGNNMQNRFTMLLELDYSIIIHLVKLEHILFPLLPMREVFVNISHMILKTI